MKKAIHFLIEDEIRFVADGGVNFFTIKIKVCDKRVPTHNIDYTENIKEVTCKKCLKQIEKHTKIKGE